MTSGPENAIVLEHVNVRLGDTQVLTDVSAHVPRGGSTAVIGPNGAGKTSLALAVLGQEPYAGSISFPAYGTRGKVRFGFVPQKLQFDRDMPVTALDFLLAGLQRRPLFLGRSREKRRQAEAILDEVECSALAGRPLGGLSGGEMQRVLLASALLRDPDILIMDEPTAGVDFKGGQLCCELLQRIRSKRGFTQVMISHDLATVAAHASHVICVRGTVIAEGVPNRILTHDVLSRTFGLHLGIPDPGMLAGNVRLCDEACPHHAEHCAARPELTACSCHHHSADANGKENGPC